MRFDLKPEVIIHKLRLFRKSCITFVWLDEHCVGHLNACTVFSCFLHPSGGGAYTQEVYHSGMAQGVDMYAAEIVLELKKQDPQITLECAIPYERQAVRWPEALRNRYFSIAERCDRETMLQRQYTPDCLRKRNRYMVAHADIVLAVWNGSPSGTGQTVWYARETGKPVWIIRPDTLEVK